MKNEKARYPLCYDPIVRDRVLEEAKKNRRTMNAELGLLIEEGLMWREMQQKQAAA